MDMTNNVVYQKGNYLVCDYLASLTVVYNDNYGLNAAEIANNRYYCIYCW